ncbi:MAG: DUF3108 domain-containing protein [Candidatus Omnitrophica bacterium]|nr:DUF3108 domain-containing protein [Candidatus Omnitrophota bacterium]
MKKYSVIFYLLALSFILGGCGFFRKAARPILKELPGLEKRIKVERVPPEKMPVLPLRPFAITEKLTYAVRWSGIDVGHAVLEVEGITQLNGFLAYHISATARSNDFFSMIYSVHDRISTFIEVEKFLPVRFEKQQREATHSRDEAIEFDQENHTAVYYKYRDSEIEKKTIALTPEVHDALSCLYYFRTLKPEVGKSAFFPVNADGKNYDMEIKVCKKEKMRIPAFGMIDTIQVEPVGKFEGIFIRKGRLWIWVTDDDRKIPVLMKSKISIGSITAVLEKIEGAPYEIKK